MYFFQKQFYLTVVAILFLAINTVHAAVITEETAIQKASQWMSENPLMSQNTRVITSVNTFPETGEYILYIVQLAPKGYLILNSDDRLPSIVSFSIESNVNLTDDPQNAFRTMLLDYCKRTKDKLDNWLPAEQQRKTDSKESTAEDELYGPFIETTWNQNNPYNLLCPANPSGDQYYNYRVPSGCVPTAFAQVLNFHRWPYRGTSSHSYTDSSGNITGTHQADFSDPYEWALMANSYNPWNTTPAPSKDAVAELMYELGVAVEINYESDGSSANPYFLGEQLGQYFFYEPVEYHYNHADLISPMEADLRAGFPCVVSIPGHAIVADGLMVNNGATTYHINYGWGETNNGWFAANSIPGGTLVSGLTSIRPLLKAFPMENSVSGSTQETVELEWIIPKRRAEEIAQLEIFRLTKQDEEWSSDGSEIHGNNIGWQIAPEGRTGPCWYAEESQEHGGTASLTLDGVFVPDASTQLDFWQFARLFGKFIIEITTDSEQSYQQIYTASSGNDIYENSWSHHSVSLAAYAGQEIKLRFLVSRNGWYGGSWPGVRLDDLAITGGEWYDWKSFFLDTTLALRQPNEVDSSLAGQPVYYTQLNNLFPGHYTLATKLTDTNNKVHGQSPTFTLTIEGDISQTHPELVILSTNTSSSNLESGAFFTANATVKNQGNDTSPETTLRFYSSTNATISTEDTLLSTQTVDSLQPNTTTEKTLNTTAPTEPGTYWIGACVDSVNGEQNTDNNCSTGVQITVQEQAYPDLVVLSSSVSSSELTSGDSFTANSTVKNQGSATSTGTMLRYYLSSDSTISTEDTLLSTQPVDSLQPNTIAEKTLNTTAPAEPGTYWIGACVDSVNGEQNTDNNCSNAVKITVSAGENKPDLVVASLQVTHFSTDSIQYTYTIKNIGDGAADLEGVSIKAFLSHNTSFNNTEDIPAGETIIGTSPPEHLEPGETYSGSFTASATVDINITPYLVLMADSGAVVDEKDESNNTLAIKIENKFPWIIFYPAIYSR